MHPNCTNLKRTGLAMILCLFSLLADSQKAGTWQIIQNDDGNAPSADYDNSDGTPASPGSRTGPITFSDAEGNLWLFGGQGRFNGTFLVANDLWKLDVNTKTWTFMKGWQGSAGPQVWDGPDALPRGRLYAQGYYQSPDPSNPSDKGSFWLFGGNDITGGANSILGDLWRFDLNTYTWIFMGGTKEANKLPVYGQMGVSAETFNPGTRMNSTLWVDNSGNAWIYGGRVSIPIVVRKQTQFQGYSFGDIWKFSNGQWAWMGGTQSTNLASSTTSPGCRTSCFGWKSPDGYLWMYGGSTINTSHTDLWKFNPEASNPTFTSVQSTNVTTPAYYGSSLHPSTRSTSYTYDGNQTIYIYGGGDGPDPTGLTGRLSDLWKLDLTSLQWLLINPGVQADQFANVNDADERNLTPGARSTAGLAFLTGKNSLMLYGGFTAIPESGNSRKGDLWQYDLSCIDPNNNTAASNSFLPCNSGTAQLIGSTGGSGYQWQRSVDNLQFADISGATNSSYDTGPLQQTTYFRRLSNVSATCAGSASNPVRVDVNGITRPLTIPAGSVTISGNSIKLSSSATSGNQWYRDGVLIPGATGKFYTATINGYYTVVVGVNGCFSQPSIPVRVKGGTTGSFFRSPVEVSFLQEESIGIFPNPVFDKLQVRLKPSDERRSVTICDANGRQVYSRIMINNMLEIDFRSLSKGIYFLQIRNVRNGEQTNYKIVK